MRGHIVRSMFMVKNNDSNDISGKDEVENRVMKRGKIRVPCLEKI